jgi:hypothetical protein
MTMSFKRNVLIKSLHENIMAFVKHSEFEAAVHTEERINLLL